MAGALGLRLIIICASNNRAGSLHFETRGKHGWEPLCEFLDLPVPEKNFPRVNSRDKTRQLIATMMAQSGDAPDEEAMSEATDKLFVDNSN